MSTAPAPSVVNPEKTESRWLPAPAGECYPRKAGHPCLAFLRHAGHRSGEVVGNCPHPREPLRDGQQVLESLLCAPQFMENELLSVCLKIICYLFTAA